MLTDGNQTFGEDYVFNAGNPKRSIYPVAVGDTTSYEDLSIDQVNANKYAFLRNKYPLEIFVSYKGTGTVSKAVSITMDGKRVFSENITLTGSDNSKVINALIEASSVGVKYLNVSVTQLEGERNTNNNKKSLAVEVIDEKTNIAIISDILHPDVGALKESLESNEQRSVSILKPNAQQLDEIDLFILYQPNSSFESVYKYIEQKNANTFSLIGPNTDLGFINRVQKQFRVEDGYPIQEVVPVKNEGFGKFDISENTFENYPPLDTDVGPIEIDGDHEALLNMRIKGVTMGSPLLTVLVKENNKKILLFGENIWKWRMQSYRDDRNFQNFDSFIGKLVVYLANDRSKERLTLDFESVYEGSNKAIVRASYFDEAFTFDTNASLILRLKNKGTNDTHDIPMLLKKGFYEADLSDRPPGQYGFTVVVKNEGQSKSGSFRILDFDVEQQLLATDHFKLQQLAVNNSGALFFADRVEELIDELVADERFKPVQSSNEKVVSLIDFRILLGVIAFTLGLEWFIRKYNGLI